MPQKKRPAAKPPALAQALPPPLAVVHGRVVRERGAIAVVAGGLRVRIWAGAAPRAAAPATAAVRRTTEATFAPYVGRDLTLTGRQVGDAIEHARAVTFAGGERAQDASAPDFATVRAAIAAHASELLGLANVIGVRPGYKFVDGWITPQPCAVVIVTRKRVDVSPAMSIPIEIDGVPTDVAPASPLQQLLARLPDLPTSGSVLGVAGVANEPVPGDAPSIAFDPERLVTSKYVPPPNLTLDASTTPMTVLAHLSPDAGFPVLSSFLSKTTRGLTVAMYDFTAPHVERAVQSAVVGGAKTLELVLDPKISLSTGSAGTNPKAGDVAETQVRDDTRALLGSRFAFRWAAVADAGKTTGGLFPSAYHIKVAVRDSRAFWLSSGNWQTTNQPDLDPLGADRDLPNVQGTYNREWHVVVDDPGLADTYERFIAYDFEQAGPFQAAGAQILARPDVFVSPSAQAAQAVTYFPPETFTVGGADGSSVQPLLTPDNYAPHVLALIDGATTSLYLQNQYIKIGKQNPPDFAALVDAIVRKTKAGLDVRIILRAIGDTRTMLESLQSAGFDMRRVRLQKACHTKGIVVDGRIVLIGSHNWSGDGTVYNRDASLIINHAGVAGYFQRAFLYDWSAQASATSPSETAIAQVAGVGDGPDGLERIAWASYYDADDLAEYDALLDRAAAAPRLDVTAAQTEPASVRTRVAMDDLRGAKAELLRRYLAPGAAAANVRAVGIGEKFSGGKPTGTMAVKLFVQTKFPREHVPPSLLLPTDVAGMPIDIDEIGHVRANAMAIDPRATLHPPQPGSSIGYGTPDGAPTVAGTFGAVVVDDAGRRYALSCSHVLAALGTLPVGAPIYQAGLLDLRGEPPRQVARLSRWIDFDGTTSAIDCAIAEESSPGLLSAEIIRIGTPTGASDATLDTIVHKSGRTTGYTVGRITSFEADVVVDYDAGQRTLTNQLIVEGLAGNAFSSAGDSGSLVVDRATGAGVGLLCAGSATHAIVNHLPSVLAALNVRLETAPAPAMAMR